MTSLATIRRGAAELLACAILDMFPTAQLIRGGVRDGLFFYDVALEGQVQLKFLEKRMRRLVAEDRPIITREMVRTNAIEYLLHLGQRRLAEELGHIEQEVVQLVEIGEFRDFCPLPHLGSTGEVGPFALLEVRSMKGGMRVEGVACDSDQKLKKFLRGRKSRVEARLLAAQLDLYSFHEASGERMWHPRGERVRRRLLKALEEGEQVATGDPARHQILLQRQQPKLPATYGEGGHVTTFCTAEQAGELLTCRLQAMVQAAKMLRFESQLSLCQKTSRAAQWGGAYKALHKALDESGFDYFVESELLELPGPTVWLQVEDRLGRERQFASLQLFAGEVWRIERRMQLSLEDLVDLELEHLDGALPFWLAPEQVRVIPLEEGDRPKAEQVCRALEGVRVHLDPSRGTLAARIRASQIACIPYVLVVGAQEGEGEVKVRKLGQKEAQKMSLEEFVERLERV